MPDMWTDPENDPRTVGNPQTEKETLTEYLDNYRLTLALKCEDLTPQQLATRSVPPSTMSLLGLVRHMAGVEQSWFQRVLQNKDEPRVYRSEEDRDLDFNGAEGTQECVDDAFATWRSQVTQAQAWLADLPESDLGRDVPAPSVTATVRDVLVHMIEEYARHCGHADLLRECIDGRTGQ